MWAQILKDNAGAALPPIQDNSQANEDQRALQQEFDLCVPPFVLYYLVANNGSDRITIREPLEPPLERLRHCLEGGDCAILHNGRELRRDRLRVNTRGRLYWENEKKEFSGIDHTPVYVNSAAVGTEIVSYWNIKWDFRLANTNHYRHYVQVSAQYLQEKAVTNLWLYLYYPTEAGVSAYSMVRVSRKHLEPDDAIEEDVAGVQYRSYTTLLSSWLSVMEVELTGGIFYINSTDIVGRRVPRLATLAKKKAMDALTSFESVPEHVWSETPSQKRMASD